MLDETAIAGALYTRGLPDPDLIVRTAGELRISNFLLWQAAYAELYVTDTLWPDFGESGDPRCAPRLLEPRADSSAASPSRSSASRSTPAPRSTPAGGMNLALRVVSGVVARCGHRRRALDRHACGRHRGRRGRGDRRLGAPRRCSGASGPTPPVWLILPLSVWLGIRFVLPAADMATDWAFAAAVVVGLLAGLG